MPDRVVPVSTARAIASGCTSTLRLMINGCSRCASSWTSTMIAIATTMAAVKPCSSRATATQSAPVTVRPTSGMNEPRKISTPSAAARGTRRIEQHDRDGDAVEHGDQDLAAHVAAEGPPPDTGRVVETFLRAAREQPHRPFPDGVAVAQQEERGQQHQQQRTEELGHRAHRVDRAADQRALVGLDGVGEVLRDLVEIGGLQVQRAGAQPTPCLRDQFETWSPSSPACVLICQVTNVAMPASTSRPTSSASPPTPNAGRAGG